MRICDIPWQECTGKIVVSFTGKLGKVIPPDLNDDCYHLIWWFGEEYPYSGFYWNDCEVSILSSDG